MGTLSWAFTQYSSVGCFRVLPECCKDFFLCLEELYDKEDSGKSHVTAISLHNKISMMETGLYTVFWDDILGQVNRTSETLQNPRLDVKSAASALTSLMSFIGTKRDSFEEYEVQATELADCTEFDSETQSKSKICVWHLLTVSKHQKLS
ncbi:hypothetical protein PR048_006715 [Dryococelus australis]|uniref:Uncharacterized protein n=1 Tax=Dryococelus australis TaxID=614101 RepID=A0ABQ9IBP9_9NEOP|nr:hypothetical protein PR048_006715 [Dryococelus australis]